MGAAELTEVAELMEVAELETGMVEVVVGVGNAFVSLTTA
jgi:hypothetical protein